MKKDINMNTKDELEEVLDYLDELNNKTNTQNPCDEVSLPEIKESKENNQYFDDTYLEPTSLPEDHIKDNNQGVAKTIQFISDYLDKLQETTYVPYTFTIRANCDCPMCVGSSRTQFKVSKPINRGHALTKIFRD